MKNVIRCIMCSIFIISFSCVCFAGIEKSGDYYRFKENGEYVYGGFVEEGDKRYYVGDNGYVAVNTWIVVSDEEKFYS
ncbi:MAG: hypothetical protein MJ151_01275 [Lachnospiraceae bacterium]|nr:hypothetical protein [Lachnospiraceae bacterium]